MELRRAVVVARTLLGSLALVAVGAGSLLVLGEASLAGATSVPAQVAAADWTSVNAPAASSTEPNGLNGVSCADPTFCIAVGSQTTSTGSSLAEQWNGSAWSIVQALDAPSTTNDELRGVSCTYTPYPPGPYGPGETSGLSAAQCLAVGSTNSGAYAEGFTDGAGASLAPAVTTTAPGATYSEFDGVSCVSYLYCMAVGYADTASGRVTLAMALNGGGWSVLPTANPVHSNDSQLSSVSCLSGTDCIAVGSADSGSATVTLAEQWNGTTWSILPTQDVAGVTTDRLNSISCIGSDFCIAAGSGQGSGAARTLVEEWSGTSWSSVTTPDSSGGASDFLTGVDCFSQTSCTAVGRTSPSSQDSTLALTWDGVGWNLQPTPNGTSSPSSELTSVSCITNWSCVAAGDSENGGGVDTPYVIDASIARSGYRFVASDGGVFAYGPGSPFLGSMGGQQLNAPIVGMATMPAGDGYYLVASDGGIFAYGSAQFYGSMGGKPLNAPIVGMAVTPDGGGYWLVASDGGLFNFGDAPFYGSIGGTHLNAPVVGMALTPDGNGYWMVASDGGVFTFGTAPFLGSMGGQPLNKPIVGIAAPITGGYYLVASDGGIFNFPNPSTGPPFYGLTYPAFYGSAGSLPLKAPIVGMTATTSGYYLVGKDGGIFSYPNGASGPPFYGSTGSMRLNAPIVGMAS